MNENYIDNTVEFWKEQFKTIDWSQEDSLNKGEVLNFQATRQIICSRMGQTCLNKEQRKSIIESFKGRARDCIQDIIERYALKD